MEDPAWMIGEPLLDLGMLVGGVVVDDGMDDLAGPDSALDGVEELDELLVSARDPDSRLPRTTVEGLRRCPCFPPNPFPNSPYPRPNAPKPALLTTPPETTEPARNRPGRRRMNYAAALATGAAIIFSSPQTFAGGESYHRTADTASIRSCDGKLVEQVQESGNMHGFSWHLHLACMQSKTDASWVLLSGTSCYDPADHPTRCNDRKVRAVPRFIVDENFWQAKETPSTTYPMLYNLLKYGIGEKCKISAQNFTVSGSYNHSSTDYYWNCDKIMVNDGAMNITTGKSKVYRLSTNSTIPIDVIDPSEIELIQWPHFVIPESEYILKLEEY
jgi:hypothetical protein